MDEQHEELEAINAIFDEDISVISKNPPCFMIKLTDSKENYKGVVNLKITFTPDYPSSLPYIEIPNRLKILTVEQHEDLLQTLKAVGNEYLGMPMVYNIVDSAMEWIKVNLENDLHEYNESNDEIEVRKTEEKLRKIDFLAPKITGGKWDLVIGLIGKPSAGKSTFFNAATASDMARMASHPFTTIEPNIAKAFYAIPCPCSKFSKICDAAYGHDFNGERLMPVLIKDVAGLVPGACDGKGRGNRFLNDLCDADVLMHIVDASGNTNEKGEQTSGYDPCLDVVWLKTELHQWIFSNVMEKWEAIKKRPEKLIDMFTGYRASPAIIYCILQGIGITDSELLSIHTWPEETVHKVVDAFIKHRFPIYLVLNKVDTQSAVDNIARLQENFREYMSKPVSAWSEHYLQDLHKKGVIKYSYGADQFQLLQKANLTSTELRQLQNIESQVLKKYGSTNVQQVLSEAIALKKPLYAFPVADLDNFISIDKYKGEGPEVLRDCVALKAGTTCEEVYTALLYPPLSLLAGDFVRAECINDKNEKRIMRKSEEIDGSLSNANGTILKIMTTRKVTPCKRR